MNPKFKNIHCNLGDNLPSSFLDATFGERLFKPKHILQKRMCFLNGNFFPATKITFIIDSPDFGGIS